MMAILLDLLPPSIKIFLKHRHPPLFLYISSLGLPFKARFFSNGLWNYCYFQALQAAEAVEQNDDLGLLTGGGDAEDEAKAEARGDGAADLNFLKASEEENA